MVLVNLPRQFTAQNLFPFIKEEFGTFQNVPNQVDFDFSRVNFVLPSGIAFLSNLSRFLLRNGCDVFYSNMNVRTPAIRFMDDALFFEQHMGKKLDPNSRPRRTTVPLIEIQRCESSVWLETQFLPWFSDCSNIPWHDLAELKTCLSELFNNIEDHTNYDVGSIFAQWYPQKERVQIAIADFGAGIPETVRTKCPELNDNQAIIMAFEDTFSTQSTPQNRGVGLYNLWQNVVQNMGGCVKIHSAGGAVKFENIGNFLRTVPYAANGYCSGTLIELEFDTSSIEITEGETEDLIC